MAPIFVFTRNKVITKSMQTKKEIVSDGELFNENTSPAIIQNALQTDLPFSLSGRTLSDILSLSYSDDLSGYTIDKVNSAWSKTHVTYSRPEPTYSNLLSEVTDLKKQMKDLSTSMKDLNTSLSTRIELLEAKQSSQESLMMAWQTAHLVFHAIGVFAWGELPAEAQNQLTVYNIPDFSTLFYRQSSKANDAATTFAKDTYQSLNAGIRRNARTAILFKQNVSEERTKLARPHISQPYLDQFLDGLGASSPDLSDLERRLFNYLRTTTITPANIQGAK